MNKRTQFLKNYNIKLCVNKEIKTTVINADGKKHTQKINAN